MWYWGAGPTWLVEYAQYVCPVMDKNNVLVDYILCPEPMVISAAMAAGMLRGLDGLDGLDEDITLSIPGWLYFGLGLASYWAANEYILKPRKKKRIAARKGK